MIEHQIEPAMAAPPPRSARLPVSLNLLLGIAVVLFCLFLYGGGRALLEALKLVWLNVGGHTVTAHIVAVQTEPAIEKGQPPHQTAIRYVYASPLANGRTEYGNAHLYENDSSQESDQNQNLPSHRSLPIRPLPVFHRGDTLLLRVASWPGGAISHPWNPPPYGKTLFLLLSGGLVVGVSVLLLQRISRWYRHRLNLLRTGIATIGTIIHKHANADDSMRYYLRYGYAVAPGGTAHERDEQCSAEQWKAFDIGQPVTVLYDPDRPDDAGLYALMGKS